MPNKKYYHDLDLVKVGQLLNTRAHNLSTTDRNSLALTLDGNHTGLFVYDTDLSLMYIWNGSAFISLSPAISGAMVFKGAVTHNAVEPVSPSVGDYYIFTSAGTNTWQSAEVVQIGDSIVYDGTNWNYIQGNIVSASESAQGTIQLATSSEVNTGTEVNKAVTPATLQGKLSNYKAAKVYFASGIDVTAGVALTVSHNLALQNRNSFTINVMDSTHSSISVDVDSVNANSLTITSSVTLTGLNITIIGF